MTSGIEGVRPLRGRAVLRGLVSLVSIVVGVLIALAADAWLQGREDVDRESTYLTALDQELAEAERELASAIERDQNRFTADSAYIAALTSDVSEPMSFFTVPFSTPTIPRGTLNALTRTGDIYLIRSPTLRAKIISFAGVLEEGLEKRRGYDDQLLALWAEAFRFLESAQICISSGEECEFEGGPTTRSERLEALRNTPGFWASRAFRADMLGNRVSLHEDLLLSVRELRAALAGELPESGAT